MAAPRLVIDALAARFGGTAHAAVHTARRLALDPAFADVAVVARRESTIARLLAGTPGLRVVTLPEEGRAELARRIAWEAVGLRRELSGNGPAAVLTWSGMLPVRPPAPVLSYLTNALMFEQDTLGNRVRRWAAGRTIRRGRVVAPTSAMAGMIERALGVEAAVVPHGVDHERFSPAAEPGTEVLCVADFYRHKRHDLVLAAWASLPAPRPPLRLVGDPRVDPAVYRETRAQIDRLRALGQIEFAADIPPDEMAATYRRARAVVVASECESFCLPLLEALACGVPAVARDLPALRETGGAGTAFVSGDDPGVWSAALLPLLADDAAYAAARASAIHHAAGYSWERTAAGLRDHLLRDA